MLSRVLSEQHPAQVTAISWRNVQGSPNENAQPAREAQEEFDRRLAQLGQQYEQRVRDAHAAGVREGEQTGRNRAAAELQPVIDRLARAIDDLAQFRSRMRREAESDMVKLSLAIARRVLRRELAIDPEALHGLVLASLEKLQLQEICRVRVHTSHAAAVVAALPKFPGGVPIEVIPDATVTPGTVVFESTHGNLDVSVETQLQEIERGLADRLRRA